jgi:hypothetical protein
MDDVVVDRYHERIARGEIINNPCSYSRTSVQETDGFMTKKYPASGATWDYDHVGPITGFYESYSPGFSLIRPVPSDLESRCKQLALRYIDSTPYAFGEDMLELRETIRFLKNPLGSLLKLSKSFKRRKQMLWRRDRKGNWRRRNAKATTWKQTLNTADYRLRAMTNIWLEYRFAAAPLMRSCLDAIGAYSSGSEYVRPLRQSARGKQTETVGTIDHESSLNGLGWRQSYKIEQDCAAHILYEISNPANDWRFTLGLRFKDFPTTLWQIVPLSFMVDRVLDVSSFAAGAINLADPNIKILSACYRSKVTTTKEVTCTDDENPSWTITGSGGKRTYETFVYERVPWIPNFLDTIPRAKPAGLVDEASKIIDLCALIASNLYWR